MKKIIGIVIASLVFCSVGFAEIKLIEGQKIELGFGKFGTISTVCVDGYKFVTTKIYGEGVSMVQFFEKKQPYTEEFYAKHFDDKVLKEELKGTDFEMLVDDYLPAKC